MRQVAYKPYLFYGTATAVVACMTASLLFLYAETSLLVSALIGINVAALVAMGLDKSLSRSQSPRIPEVVLYSLALLGGSPGILAGIHIFRHKTRKAVFQFTLLVVFTLQVALARLLEIQVR